MMIYSGTTGTLQKKIFVAKFVVKSFQISGLKDGPGGSKEKDRQTF